MYFTYDLTFNILVVCMMILWIIFMVWIHRKWSGSSVTSFQQYKYSRVDETQRRRFYSRAST